MLGLKGTWTAIKNANGPAQHILYGIWGFIIAGIYIDMGAPLYLVGTWAFCSLLTIIATIWLSRNFLKNILLVDVALTAMVLGLYVSNTNFMLTEAIGATVYYINDANGMIMATRSNAHVVDSWTKVLDFISHVLPCIVLLFHGLYLANLVQRQELEKKRFSNDRT